MNYSFKYIVLLLLGIFIASSQANENDWFKYLGDGKPYQAPPKGISSAEALPPLPLPATPLRRTERKKPPQPDYLFGKIIWGESAIFTTDSGNSMEVADWNLCPTDLDRLMDNVRKINLNYHWQNVSLANFSYDPTVVPSLVFTGTRTIRLGETQLESLRNYVLTGGTIIFDSIAGSPYFYRSAYDLIGKLVPECQLRNIPQDHPLYHIMTDIDNVEVPLHKDIKTPDLEGVYIGSRLGIIVSKHGLGCGWNNNTEPLLQLPQGSYFSSRTATALGLNLAGYIVGYTQAGLIEGQPEIFSLTDMESPTDEFIFAQIKHEGSWNVHPNAAVSLLMKIRQNTSIKVNLQRHTVIPGKNELGNYPFLYLTGQDSFSFSEKEIAALQNYLANGGFLLINNGMGISRFDNAVKRELTRITKGIELNTIPAGHELYSSFYRIEKFGFSPAVEADSTGIDRTRPLQGINIGGELKIIYSPLDIEAGWLNVDYPLIRGFDKNTSRQLGVNIITYILTH